MNSKYDIRLLINLMHLCRNPEITFECSIKLVIIIYAHSR